jgi:hypothetical protein
MQVLERMASQTVAAAMITPPQLNDQSRSFLACMLSFRSVRSLKDRKTNDVKTKSCHRDTLAATMPQTLFFKLAILLATTASTAAGFDHSYTGFVQVLHRYVQDGQVDYAALRNQRAGLDQFLREAGAVKEADYKSWSREQQIAFLINVYNAGSLQLVIDHYPVSSIKRIGGWFGSPFRITFIPLFGSKVSLDEIEHGMLLPFGEPRVHFALVCAARSCPPLRREAYTAAKLNQQLDDQARLFLNDITKNRVELETGTVHLSRIFKWFGDDFGGEEAAVVKSISRYWPASTQRVLAQKKTFKVRYLDYDWKLNDHKR